MLNHLLLNHSVSKETVDYNKVQLLLPMDGNFKDYSKNNFPVTNNGVILRNNDGKFGYSGYHQNRTFIQLPLTNKLDFGTKDFTIELNARISAVGPEGAIIFGRWGSSPNTFTEIGFAISSNRLMPIINGVYWIDTGVAIVDNINRHMSLNRKGPNIFVTLEGILVASVNIGINTSINFSNQRAFRTSVWDDINGWCQGTISDIRIIIDDCIYTDNHDVPSSPFHK